MKTKIYFLFIATAIGVVGCTGKNNAEHNHDEHETLPANTVEMNDTQCKSAGIELGSIELKPMNTSLKANGVVSVSPLDLISVSAIMGGYIKSIKFVQGSPVKKGQVIATIENPDFIELQQNYLESKNKLEYAETEYLRQKDLYKDNINAAKTYQSAYSEYKSLQATVVSSEQKLKMIGIDVKKLQVETITGSISIVSPINGYVKTVSVNIGKYVNPTDVIMEIVNTQNLSLELTLFEKDIDKVIVGQKISFSTPTKPEQKQSATIYQVGKTINDDKSIKVYANIDTENKNLLPGMFVNALIETQNDTVVVLPEEAVLSFEDKNYIFVFLEKKKEDNKTVSLFKAVEIKTGVSANGFTEIILPKEFDKSSNKIVKKGAYHLLSALKNAGDMAC